MVNFFMLCFSEGSKYKVSSPQRSKNNKSKPQANTMQPSSSTQTLQKHDTERHRHSSGNSSSSSSNTLPRTGPSRLNSNSSNSSSYSSGSSSTSQRSSSSPERCSPSPPATASPTRHVFRSTSANSDSSKYSTSSLSSEPVAMSISSDSAPPSSRASSESSLSTEDSPDFPRRCSKLDDDSGQHRTTSGGGFSKTSGLVGLRNIGNTCFLNSVTQCLSNTRCLLEYLVKEGYSTDINTSSLSTMKGDLIRAFGNLICEMWTEGDSNRALNTGPFKTQIQKFAPTFTGYQQHDAQEFLRKLLEGLHEDVNRVTTRPRPILSDIDDDLSDDQKAMESWKRYLRFDDSKIVDMFVGQLKSSLQCSHCSHTSVTFDPFWDLSLPIPNKSGTVRLNQCLDLFTKEEVMDGDERPTCSKCKERRKMTKSFNIQKFPRVLVLHLKRFSPTERWRGKLSGTVEFPLENLDLSKYASSSRSTCNYNLIGVANHSGTTYSGHYTAFCRHPYSNEWHEYNDSRVSSIPARRVCSPEAYVLFYELSKL